MGVLSTQLTDSRVDLAAAPTSFTNLKANQEVGDLPASNLHQVFKLEMAGGPRLLAIHGTTTAEYEADIRLEIHWDPKLDTEAIHNTIADDLTDAMHVLLKASNRATGVVLITPGTPFSVEQVSTNDIRAVGTFIVRFRETQDMT